ncbi:C6 transcription factor [Apiospora rasikravindrae]|uniref:C6 transcription factor n=1 Tax=Apiospora rasikravindrae TaxID=990691 RepID=A0ABR1TIF1_9PEZI
MGRWGHRLFEGDQDLDIACEINNTFQGDEEIRLSRLVHQTDMLAPQDCKDFYQTEEYKVELAQKIVEDRRKLDAGFADRLFDIYRAKEHEDQGKYRVVLVGALIMRAGAKIRDGDLQHLRDLVPEIHCSPKFALPMFDEGFRSPGKAQFLAALDHYTPGTPRNFSEPSCFTCGKVEADIGNAPMSCARCKGAWYCDTACQRAHWKVHKPTCVVPGKLRWQSTGNPGGGVSAVSVERIRFLIIIPKFQTTSPDSAGPRINPNAMSGSGAVSTKQQMAPSAAKQQKKSAFSCHNCRSRKRVKQLIDESSAPTLSYTERLEQRIKELEGEVQRLKGAHGSEAEAQTPETPEDASISESTSRQPTDQPKQRLSGSYDGLKVDEKGVITYHGATSFFQAISGNPSKVPENEEQDEAGSSRSAQDLDRRQRLVTNAWHQRALECFTNIPVRTVSLPLGPTLVLDPAVVQLRLQTSLYPRHTVKWTILLAYPAECHHVPFHSLGKARSDDDSAEEELWIPHGVTFAPGKQYPPTPAHSTSCFIKMCELSVIFNQILINIYDPLQQLSPSIIEDCVLTLNSLYHTFKILLFRPTLVKRSRQSSGERTQNQDHLKICVASAVSIAAIFDLFCRTFGEDHCITSLSYSLYIATSIFLLQVQALPGDTQALRRLLFCVQYLERVQTINPVIGSALRPMKEVIVKLGLDQQAAVPQQTTVSSPEASEGGTFSSPSATAGYEPGQHHAAAARPSRDFHGDQFGTAADVDFSLMPDDMFEALSTLEPMSVSIQPLDHSNASAQQPTWPFAGR